MMGCVVVCGTARDTKCVGHHRCTGVVVPIAKTGRAPALDDRTVVYRGPVGGRDRTNILGSARALLHLVNFNEPFGLSVVEALASGTPVIASNRGSMPELIDHGVTGFLVDNIDDAVDAIGRIGEIDRAACRAAVSARFTVDRMADRYVELYRSLLG